MRYWKERHDDVTDSEATFRVRQIGVVMWTNHACADHGRHVQSWRRLSSEMRKKIKSWKEWMRRKKFLSRVTRSSSNLARFD